MPSVHLAQWAFHDRSGLAKDMRINTFWFWGPIGVPTDYDNVRDVLHNFYFQMDPALQNVAQRLSSRLGPTSGEKRWSLRLYDMDQPKPRIPVYEDEGTDSASAGAGTNLPSEVALVVSFQAERVPGIPQARRRNRIYLGPLRSAAGTSGADDVSRPNPDALAIVQASAARLIEQAQASLSWNFIAYSPTYAQGAPEVTDGWVDNAWDTQRRRGREPTERGAFSPGAP